MAKLKMLKLPKKPKRSANLDTKQKWIVKAHAIKKENQRRAHVNNASEKASKVIAGIGSTFVSPSGFSARVIRPSRRRHKKAAAAPKRHRKASVKKTAHKRKSSHKRK